jgi:hypothetical protein
MNDNRKQKLIELGPETLAETLLDLSIHSDEADDLIDRLIAAPKENVQRFKKKLTDLKRSRRFIDWRGAAGFARKLEMLLQDVKAGVDDPLTGIELVAAFYEADNTIFDMCDDSIPFLRCAMTPVAISVMYSAMMPKGCLLSMPPVVLKKKKLRISS